jgi:hypothetical protein
MRLYAVANSIFARPVPDSPAPTRVEFLRAQLAHLWTRRRARTPTGRSPAPARPPSDAMRSDGEHALWSREGGDRVGNRHTLASYCPSRVGACYNPRVPVRPRINPSADPPGAIFLHPVRRLKLFAGMALKEGSYAPNVSTVFSLSVVVRVATVLVSRPARPLRLKHHTLICFVFPMMAGRPVRRGRIANGSIHRRRAREA